MRELDDIPLEAVSTDDLRRALRRAGDEDDRWEAKGGEVRPEHVQRAAAGLANRDGGSVVLGAERTGDGWALTGLQAPRDDEPGTWLARVLRSGLRPLPPVEQRVYGLEDGRWAALVRVAPHPQHVVVLPNGQVLRREHGETRPIDHGSELGALIFERAGRPDGQPIDPDQPPERLARLVTASLRSGVPGPVRPLLAGLRRLGVHAAEHEPTDVLTARTDALAAVTGALVIDDSEHALLDAALTTHHGLFDDAVALRQWPTARPDLDLQRQVRRIARAVGALLARLDDWDGARVLAAHSGPAIAGHPRGWISTVAANEAHAAGRPLNSESWRHGIRQAAETIMRIEALRPDGAGGNDPLDSVLVFDMVCGLVELDTADRVGAPLELWPDFARFDARPLRPIAAKIVADPVVRGRLLPDRSDRDAARLLAHLDASASRTVTETGFWDGLFDAAAAERVRQLSTS